jgi:hypothetical protein
VAAETLTVAEFEKEKWSKVATILKGVHEGKEWNAKFLAKTFGGISKKKGLRVSRGTRDKHALLDDICFVWDLGSWERWMKCILIASTEIVDNGRGYKCSENKEHTRLQTLIHFFYYQRYFKNSS